MAKRQRTPNTEDSGTSSPIAILLVFLRLGLTSFGGPVAHLGYFHDEFVDRRKWLESSLYADLIALCQFLPGPASSQVGFAIGMIRGGSLGALAAWIGFTLPSVTLMILFAISLISFGEQIPNDAIKGLKLVAVAVIAKAIWDMARSLAPDRERMTMALAAAAILMLWSGALAQIAVIVAGGILGWLFLRAGDSDSQASQSVRQFSKAIAATCLILFGLLLIGLPLLASLLGSHTLEFVNSFYRTGSLVFGGGHVVLPLLEEAVVEPGWVSEESFLAGYGFAQALPGPLFAFSSFLGYSAASAPNGLWGSLMALLAIYLPSFLLVWGILPFWSRLRENQALRNALMGVNAVVVGLLIAAFYQPVFTSSIESPLDLALGLVAFAVLAIWKVPPWVVVLVAGMGGFIFGSFLL